MVKKTIVRVAKGFDLSETMLFNLGKLFEHGFDIEHYDKETDLHRSYIRRVDILKDAFHFIKQSIPHKGNPDEIVTYLEWAYKQAQLPSDLTLNEYQAALSKFTALLVDALADYWDFPITGKTKIEAAVELLNKAEQYVIMQRGRQDLATLSHYEGFKEGELILQWDKQLKPCTQETLDELTLIKNYEFDCKPAWLASLLPYQQIYFLSSDFYLKKRELLKTDISRLDSYWRALRGIHPEASLIANFASIAEGNTNLPEWYTKLSASHKAVIKYLSISAAKGISNIDTALQELGRIVSKIQPNMMEDILKLRNLPYWFLALPEHEQRLLKASLLAERQIEDAVSFLPSRLRTLPGVANFAEHNLLVLNADGETITKFPKRIRFSHPCSRDVKDMPSQIGDLHTERNIFQISQFAEGKELLIQTLISPVYLLDGTIPDYALNTQLQKGVKKFQQTRPSIPVYSPNHPFNMAKYYYYTTPDNPECLALLFGAERKLSQETVEQHINLLGVEESEFLTEMAMDSIKFTCVNSKFKAFTGLMQLIEKNPLPLQGIRFDKIKTLVRLAYIEAGILVRNKETLYQGGESSSAESELKLKLVDLFVKNYPDLSLWKGWESIFSAHCYSRNNQSNPLLRLDCITSLCDLAQLKSDYYNLLNSGFGTATFWDYHGRELYLSSLENLLIIQKGDISSGSCVSGKDRKALELIHTDAMLLYRKLYGSWPSYNDKGILRENFVDLVADLYVQRHPHDHAGQNAPGSDGIKTPSKYFPTDIGTAICNKMGKYALKIDDTLATNNEVSRIGNVMNRCQEHYATCIIAALKLSEQGRERLLTTLFSLTEERAHWADKTIFGYLSGYSPSGIGQVRDVIGAKLGVKTNIEVLAEVYYLISMRPDTSSKRADETQEVYSSILRLRNHPRPDEILEDELATLIKAKGQAYAFNGQLMAGSSSSSNGGGNK